jgi:aryl-alcohol dehydrogenase-like predicted oxidoreductase
VVASGVNHIDTADFYGPHVTNRIIREALHVYPKGLVIVTKVGARRGADASWAPAFSGEELTQAVHDNLRNLGVDVLDVVNLRAMFDVHHPAEGIARGAAHRACRPAEKGIGASCRAEATSRPSKLRTGDGSARSSAYRTTTIWRTGPTTP